MALQNSQDADPVVKLVKDGFPINEPINKTGTTLTMLAVSAKLSNEMFTKIL